MTAPTITLAFNYRSTSTLPRREWLVTVRLLGINLGDFLTFAVESPDVFQTSRLVRNFMAQTYPDYQWMEWTVREIVQLYHSNVRSGRVPSVVVHLLEGNSYYPSYRNNVYYPRWRVTVRPDDSGILTF